MCQSEPSIYGMELDPGMEIEDGVPDCCYGPMDQQKPESCICCTPGRTGGEGSGTHVEFVCSDCGTAVEVSGLGLVHDICYKQPA